MMKWQNVLQTGRKHCAKKRNCSLQAISPFPTAFSKGLNVKGSAYTDILNPKRYLAIFYNSIDMENKVFISFFKLQVFIATQGVGTHHKKFSNKKILLHQNFIITHIDNFII